MAGIWQARLNKGSRANETVAIDAKRAEPKLHKTSGGAGFVGDFCPIVAGRQVYGNTGSRHRDRW